MEIPNRRATVNRTSTLIAMPHITERCDISAAKRSQFTRNGENFDMTLLPGAAAVPPVGAPVTGADSRAPVWPRSLTAANRLGKHLQNSALVLTNAVSDRVYRRRRPDYPAIALDAFATH